MVGSRFELFCRILFLSGTKEVGIIVNNAANIDKYWRGRKDSHPQPSDPKSDALSSWATPALSICKEKTNVSGWILTLQSGASEGIWTLDHWNHNPALYQLSYARHHSNNNGLGKIKNTEKPFVCIIVCIRLPIPIKFL